MLYGRHDGVTGLMVAAADSMAEFEEFAPSPEAYLELVEPDFTEILTDPRFNRFKKFPYLYAFTDALSRDAFVATFGIRIETHQRLVDLNEAMLVASQQWINDDDSRTLAEIHGLDQHDPWDERTEAQKERDAATKSLIEEAKKNGTLSGDGSFKPKGRGFKIGNVTVNEVVKVGPGGGVSVSVSAHKRGNEDDESKISVEMIDMSAIYNRVFVDGRKTADLEQLLGDVLFRQILRREDTDTGCWFDVLLQRHAREAVDVLRDNYTASMTITVDALGEQMLPTGTTVVDEVEKRVIGPRPWKDQAEWDALTPEERTSEIKNIGADEFLMYGYSRGLHGCRVYFVPTQYWVENEEFWTGDMHLDAILPQWLKNTSNENHPGRYDASMDLNSMSLMLNKAGFREDMMFMIHVNGIVMLP
jgi:hypothetical protein